MNEESKENEKLKRIVNTYFSQNSKFEISSDSQKIPLVAANVIKSTRSFSEGQILYIYDGYWGMAERVKVIGRFRRKNNWIKGVIPIKNLDNFRADEVYKPVVISKLSGETIAKGLFYGFLILPESEASSEKHEEELNLITKILRLFKKMFD